MKESRELLPARHRITLPSQGHFALGLGEGVGLLSLRTGVGTGGSLLSLGVNLDPPAFPPPSGRAAAGSPDGLLSPGVRADPPALPPGAAGIGGALPPVNVSVVTPLPPHSAPPTLPTLPLPGGSGAAVFPLPVVTAHPIAPVEAASAPDASEIHPALVAGSGNDFSSPIPPSATINDLTFESFLPPRKREVAGQSPRGEIAGDELIDELFDLRGGRLLEDFGTAIAQDRAVVADSSTNGEPVQGESDGAIALWLVGVLAGCVASAAWLNRRGEEATNPVDADPCLNPSG